MRCMGWEPSEQDSTQAGPGAIRFLFDANPNLQVHFNYPGDKGLGM